MAHGTRVRIDSLWATGPVVTGTELYTIDLTLTAALNGDGGGSWTPAAPIVLGGAGLWIGGPALLSNGPNVLTSAGNHIVQGSNDYIYLGGTHTSATRVIDTPLQGYVTQGATGNDQTYFAVTGRVGNSGFAAVPSVPSGTRFLTPLAVHNGATLASAVLTFRVMDSHASGIPDSLPAFRLLAVDVNGNVLPLSSTTYASSDGSVALTRPATNVLYVASNAAQTISMTCDQNNVIDVTKYAYLVEVTDETGANSYQAAQLGNVFHSVTCTFTGIADLRPQ